ncbi:MAG: hypothetical protein WCX88_01125 [Patescibacteria group bacterium]
MADNKTENQKQRYTSAQKYLPIAEIKDDCVVLKNGALRAVILVSSINLSLKSPDEQEAIIMSYRNFLNTLHDWNIQIVIQSRKIDVDNYLNSLIEKAKVQENELLQMQMRDYIQYVSELVDIGQITTKKFYIVIPHSSSEDKSKGIFSKIMGAFSSPAEIALGRKNFSQQKELLFKRVDYVRSGLSGMNLASAVLNTQSLIELYYNTYNPSIYASEKIPNKIEDLKIEADK